MSQPKDCSPFTPDDGHLAGVNDKAFLNRLACKPVDGINPREVLRLLWMAISMQERLSASSEKKEILIVDDGHIDPALLARLVNEKPSEIEAVPSAKEMKYPPALQECLDAIDAHNASGDKREPSLDLKHAQSAELWVESPDDFLDGWDGEDLPPTFHAYAIRLYKAYKAVSERSAIVPHPDTVRVDFMERFIVHGTWWSGIAEGKIAWLADAECLRETIDSAMSRSDGTGEG